MGDPAERKSFIDNLAAIVGIVGSAITVVLTLQNNHTKRQIDEAQQKLQAEPLSPAGLVNALYFLSRTQRTAWPPENLGAWETVRTTLGQVATGTQSKALLALTEKQVASYRP